MIDNKWVNYTLKSSYTNIIPLKKLNLNFLAQQFWLGSSGAAGAFKPDLYLDCQNEALYNSESIYT